MHWYYILLLLTVSSRSSIYGKSCIDRECLLETQKFVNQHALTKQTSMLDTAMGNLLPTWKSKKWSLENMRISNTDFAISFSLTTNLFGYDTYMSVKWIPRKHRRRKHMNESLKIFGVLKIRSPDLEALAEEALREIAIRRTAPSITVVRTSLLGPHRKLKGVEHAQIYHKYSDEFFGQLREKFERSRTETRYLDYATQNLNLFQFVKQAKYEFLGEHFRNKWYDLLEEDETWLHKVWDYVSIPILGPKSAQQKFNRNRVRFAKKELFYLSIKRVEYDTDPRRCKRNACPVNVILHLALFSRHVLKRIPAVLDFDNIESIIPFIVKSPAILEHITFVMNSNNSAEFLISDVDKCNHYYANYNGVGFKWEASHCAKLDAIGTDIERYNLGLPKLSPFLRKLWTLKPNTVKSDIHTRIRNARTNQKTQISSATTVKNHIENIITPGNQISLTKRIRSKFDSSRFKSVKKERRRPWKHIVEASDRKYIPTKAPFDPWSDVPFVIPGYIHNPSGIDLSME